MELKSSEEEKATEKWEQVFSSDKTMTEVLDGYDNWAETYEQGLKPEWYSGPSVAVELVSRYFKENRHGIRILDVAAGTGLLGEKLKALGFLNIDAIDHSKSMIQIAESKNIYQQMFCESITKEQTSIKENTYDCIASSGGFLPGHIPFTALYEFIRVVKPGGLIIFVMREEYLDSLEYKDKLEPLMKTLEEAEKKWKKVERYQFDNYVFGKTGIAYIFRVL